MGSSAFMKKKGGLRMNKKIIKTKTTGLIAILLLGMLLVAGCTSPRYGNIIDWIDFVNVDDTIYEGVSNGVLRDSGSVTDEVVGVVGKKLDGNVKESSYQSRPGDAAYLEEGTELYRIDGFEPTDLLAVRDEQKIGGYMLYAREQYEGLPDENFKSVLRADPTSVSIHRWREAQPTRTVTGSDSAALIELLRQAVYAPDDLPPSSQEPKNYEIVFDTGEPVLYTFRLDDDGETVRFRELYRVDEGILDFLP